MQQLEKILIQTESQHIGIITAHPDDHLSFASGIEVAKNIGIDTHEFMLTRGRQGTKNYLADSSPEFNIAEGDRYHEGAEAAHALGINSNTLEIDDAPDGDVWSHRDRLVPKIGEWVVGHGIDTLMLMGMHDHKDHFNSKRIGRLVASQLFLEGYELGVLEVQTGNNGEYLAEANDKTVQRLISGAFAHKSQIQIATQAEQPSYRPISGNTAMSQYDYEQMKPYPFFRDATYDYHAAGSLIVMSARR